MSESDLNPLESILRLCAAAAPEPWYPRLYAKQTGVDSQALGRCLEELWLSGLIEKTPATDENGPAIVLTRAGERVLLDPEALRRLRAGEPLSEYDRGALIRQALRGEVRPLITVLLVLLNVLVFAAGYYQARQQGQDSNFLRGSPVTLPVLKLLEASGALVPRDLVDGQWWRLLTAGFVHIGFMHILMNMACLYLAGRFIEQMWGHLRYLVIYLVALLGGSVLMAAHPVDVGAGASGAICGILAAEAVWFLFNRRYLPRSILRQAWTSFIINFILLVFISSFKNVSGWAHFGGAVAGASAALLLHLHRFGPPVWRWLALTGFIPLMGYGYFAIERARATESVWLKAEDEQFENRWGRRLTDALEEAGDTYFDEVQPVLQTHPTRREAAEVEKALPLVIEQKEKLTDLHKQLLHVATYHNPKVQEAYLLGHQAIDASIDLFKQAEHHLRVSEQRTDRDRETLRTLELGFKETRRDWRARETRP